MHSAWVCGCRIKLWIVSGNSMIIMGQHCYPAGLKSFSTLPTGGHGQLIQPSSLTPAGKYCYGDHLRQLEACKPECRGVPPWLMPVITPLDWRTWDRALQLHPDRNFVAYIVGGLRDGFRVGFNRASHACVSAKHNMLSAAQHPEVIDAYLEEEHTCGRIIGPLDAYEAEGVHISLTSLEVGGSFLTYPILRVPVSMTALTKS